MERFSIDDAIKQSKIVANRYKWSVENADMGSEDANELNADICNRYVKEYRQIAKWLEEFKSYKQAEEHGLLVRLPCKVGDIVHDSFFGYPEPHMVKAISYGYCIGYVEPKIENEIIFYCENYTNTMKVIFPMKELGKTVFLTREEAEKKLEEMKKE